jgi:uncharacterized protein (DUF1684 family)
MRTLFLFVLIALGLQALAQPDEKAWRAELTTYWFKIDSAFRDTLHSPLPAPERKAFKALERYPIDLAYRVEAQFESNEGPVFGMKTTSEREPKYRSVGTLRFVLQGKEEQLIVYKNIDLSRLDEYRNYLFVPFTDLTNGETTYGGGRYIDLEGPLGGTVTLDFNKAYNPYCAYGGLYSCPIPPEENHLELRVEAGVLKFHD